MAWTDDLKNWVRHDLYVMIVLREVVSTLESIGSWGHLRLVLYLKDSMIWRFFEGESELR